MPPIRAERARSCSAISAPPPPGAACRGRPPLCRFVAFCEHARMPTEEVRDREATRTRVFDAAQALAAALAECKASERWEPLRDVINAGLQAGGFNHDADTAAVRTAAGELAAAALDARRRPAGRAAASGSRARASGGPDGSPHEA